MTNSSATNVVSIMLKAISTLTIIEVAKIAAGGVGTPPCAASKSDQA